MNTENREDLEKANREFFQELSKQGEDLMRQSDTLALAINNLYRGMTSPRSAISYRKEAERTRFRGSDLPFCPLKFMLDNVREKPRYEEVNYMSEFFTSGGDAFHATLQRWLGASGHMWGKFKCSECGKLYPEDSKAEDNQITKGPIYCCGKLADYEELQVSGKHFSGHMDGLLKFHRRFIASEFKQMGERIFSRRMSSGYDKHHFYQIQVYRALLPKWLGLHEDEFHPFVLLWYFERGDCKVNHPWILKYDPSVYEQQLALVIQTKRYIDKKQYRKCKGICNSHIDNPHCPYNQMVCFASQEQREKIIDVLINIH